jgi:uncharacterized protein YhfF
VAQTIDEFWQACQRALPQETAGTTWRVRRFGDDPAMARRLLDLVRTGEKSGTFAVDWEFEANPRERPAPGDLYVVTDAAGEPGALIRITRTAVVPFSAISAGDIRCEGPALRDLALWRKVHWDFWSRRLRATGREPAEDMPVLCQWFALLRT